MAPLTPMDRWLIELWGTPKEQAELLWGQTEADRIAVSQWHADCVAAQAKHAHAVEVNLTDTRDETPAPATVRVLFPIWHAEAPMETALKLAVARIHLEAA